MRIHKVNWITAHNYGMLQWNLLSSHYFKLKRDIVSQNVPKKTNYWTKIADLGIIFLRRSYIILWYQLLHLHIVPSIPFLFYGPPCIYRVHTDICFSSSSSSSSTSSSSSSSSFPQCVLGGGGGRCITVCLRTVSERAQIHSWEQ